MAFQEQEFDTVASLLDKVFPEAVADVRTEANFRSMLLAARDALPDEERIFELLAVHSRVDRQIDGSVFEGVVGTQARFATTSRRVCEIKPATSNAGTGFLVGPDLILTSAHVLRNATGEWVDPTAVSVKFDALVWSDETLAMIVRCRIHPSATFPLAFSRAPLDDLAEPTENELDYALFRIAPALGEGALPNASINRRGWFDCSTSTQIPPLDTAVSILQHPNGQLLRTAAGRIRRVGVNSTRMFYDASTEAGSSGGPVLDSSNRVVALHVWSDRVDTDTFIANEGVTLPSIIASLAAQNITLPPLP